MSKIHQRAYKDVLTFEKLLLIPPETIFAQGETVDSPNGCNVADTGKTMRWVAVRGYVADWAIYVQNPHYINSNDFEVKMLGLDGVWPWEKIAQVGDKVTMKSNIEFLVPCNDEAFKRYNY
ncbi:hypothetical protein CVU83_01770 [Candidatus Falkowbacteria bacterium HGW-Falkowbacteria-2]|uniref:Uncharacterized protein n=1 Tax=Candidatus Falkowbacteria bacterium HGW-Falkowbacteria-2 TaxID=2013769 RepID=A0A2N2E104_9BACT|nr:MAG: hypothetical protein CVU83_01770 [Candidatus Falkowbacteria bacterium HGW-Falkowbacteria-2]